MNQNSNQPNDLYTRFPQMKPMGSTPTLFRLNGCGVGLYGNRDHDHETNTYVKTYCFCLLFIPVLAFSAYRVADAESGWYFIGKEPLSKFARTWNWWMLTLMIALGGMMSWEVHTSSADYKAQQELSKAADALQAGDTIKAATFYRHVAEGAAMNVEGRQGLQKSLEQCLQSDSPEKVAFPFHLIANSPRLNQPPLIPDAFARGLSLVNKFKTKNVEGALIILEDLFTLEPKNPALPPLRLELLQQAIAANPDNIKRVVQLALLYEGEKQFTECKELLTPRKDKLGQTEGARILGQLFMQAGEYESAYGLLFPYVQLHLDSLHKTESAYTNAINGAYNRALESLRSGNADPSFYQKYDKASKVDKATMVDEYIAKRLKTDRSYLAAAENLKAANQIVTVALDLGIVQLNRAQSLKDPAARKVELEAAEKTFLAIRSFAGESDEYRLFFGQVCYWLGKSAEGRELFDQLLVSNKRSYNILMQLTGILREVGDFNAARDLCEEAYQVAKSMDHKYAAASLRAVTQKDNDDQIAWLEKADPNAIGIQIELNAARGDRALEQGNKVQAAEFLRKAIGGYEKLPKSSTGLNNCGLVYLSLYRATSDPSDHKRGVAQLEEAIALTPGDSLLLMNTTHLLISSAVMETIGDSLHLAALGETPSLRMLNHLYDREEEKAAIFQRLRENETMKKAMVYLDKALLLSPKNLWLYRLQLEIQKAFRDLAELQRLQQRLAIAQPDFVEDRKSSTEMFTGTKDKENLEKYQAAFKKYAALFVTPAVRDHAATLDFVSASANGMRAGIFSITGLVETQKMLEEAQMVFNKHSSSASSANLSAALFFQAHATFLANAEYAAIAIRTRRAIDPRHLIAFLLEQNGSLSQMIRQDPTVLKALALEKAFTARLPKSVGSDDWALFRFVDPQHAQTIATQFQGDATQQAIQALESDLFPMNATDVMEHYWNLKMSGNEKKAREIYAEAVERGVPLPAL